MPRKTTVQADFTHVFEADDHVGFKRFETVVDLELT